MYLDTVSFKKPKVFDIHVWLNIDYFIVSERLALRTIVIRNNYHTVRTLWRVWIFVEFSDRYNVLFRLLMVAKRVQLELDTVWASRREKKWGIFIEFSQKFLPPEFSRNLHQLFTVLRKFRGLFGWYEAGCHMWSTHSSTTFRYSKFEFWFWREIFLKDDRWMSSTINIIYWLRNFPRIITETLRPYKTPYVSFCRRAFSNVFWTCLQTV